MQTTSRGHRISYVTAGDPTEPALLLVHGILQSAARWAEIGYLDEFAERYHVIAVDLLGHGESDKPTEPSAYTIDGHVSDLVQVLDAEGVGAFHLWGYSGGAAVALAVAAAAPERARSVVIGGIPPSLPQDARAAVFGPWIDALQAGDWDRFWQAFLPVPEATQALLQRGNDPAAIAAWLAGAVSTAELVEPGDVPTLVYMGEEELFFDDARTSARQLGADFATIPERGHAGAFQDLAAVGPIVRSFLERVDHHTETTT